MGKRTPEQFLAEEGMTIETAKVASDHFFDGYSLSKNVTPVYEGEREC